MESDLMETVGKVLALNDLENIYTFNQNFVY